VYVYGAVNETHQALSVLDRSPGEGIALGRNPAEQLSGQFNLAKLRQSY